MSKSFSLALALLLAAFAAGASTPPSQDVTVSTVDGETTVLEWTGTALPGASGAANACEMAADDEHAVVFNVPAGAYDAVDAIADFHVEWDAGTEVPGVATDPDLVLTVFVGSTAAGSSDGGAPEENVRAVSPTGTVTAVVCPFFASQPTPYRGKLTLTIKNKAACLTAPTKALAHSTLLSGGAGLGDDEALFRAPNLDRYSDETQAVQAAVPDTFQGRRQDTLFDRTMGLPTFLWAKPDAPIAAVGALNTKALLTARARAHLKNEAKPLKLTSTMIDEAVVDDAQYNGKGPATVRLRQNVNGHEVYERYLNVLINREGRPMAVSGYFATDYDPAAVAATRFAYTAPQAITAAWAGLGGSVSPAAFSRALVRDGYEFYSLPSLTGNYRFERAPRVKAIYYPRKGALEPAYYVELFAKAKQGGDLLAYSMVVSAADNTVLARSNLKSHATEFSYRVFADPNGIHQPFDEPTGNDLIPFPFASPDAKVNPVSAETSLIKLISGPISTGDPWLPDGATQTTGNHSDACIDNIDIPNPPIAVPGTVNNCVPNLEMRAKTTSANTFDYPIKAFDDPSTANGKNAAVVSMFYTVNWLHDWWYDHGFNEAGHNAQTDNYDRGGNANDPLLAQGQDGSGRNNANMATPADGTSPVMQQYLFNGIINGEVNVTSDPAIGKIAFNAVEYGPQTFDYTGTAQVVNDGFDPTNDACTGMSTPAGPAAPVVGSPTVPIPVPVPDRALMGKIAVIVRGGGCPGSNKVRYAVASGAAAVLLVHNGDGPPPYLANGDIPIDAPAQPTNMVYNIPIAVIKRDDGQKIMDQIAAGTPVTVHMLRGPTVDLDGTLDTLIIAHEYFHYVHYRNTSGNQNQTRSMSEGWGDTDAFMVAAREGENRLPGNDKWQGAYPGATYVTQSFFYGIRRAPYSTDMAKNAFTYKHISNGVVTPDGGDGSINSEVHNSGEIWANMMWECYVGLLNDPRHSFAEAQDRMKDYIIGGLKMTPAGATFTEGRDAILSVVLASDFQDYANCSGGFAKRGLGLNAIAPARASTDHVGAVEDFAPFVCKAGVTPVPTTPPVITPGPVGTGGVSTGSGRFGGGALNLLLLLPLLGFGLLRRRRVHCG